MPSRQTQPDSADLAWESGNAMLSGNVRVSSCEHALHLIVTTGRFCWSRWHRVLRVRVRKQPPHWMGIGLPPGALWIECQKNSSTRRIFCVFDADEAGTDSRSGPGPGTQCSTITRVCRSRPADCERHCHMNVPLSSRRSIMDPMVYVVMKDAELLASNASALKHMTR